MSQSPIGHRKPPSPEECCRVIYKFMREHEAIFRKAPHMNLTRSEWRRLKELARQGMGK